MKLDNKVFSLLVVFALILLGGCKDQWEEHTKIKDGLPTADLMKEIKSNSDLSMFADFLVRTGLDKEMEGSKLLTVWAPNNDALQNAEIPQNDSLLKQLVLNHVSYERVNYTGINEQFRHKMANGKYLELDTEAGTIDGVELIGDEDNVATNGVLHIVSQVIPVRKNIWEYFETATQGRKHIDYIIAQDRYVFNADLATQIGVDPTTGAPIYDTITGMELVNTYIRDVVDLKNEDIQITYFVYSDPSLQMEEGKFNKYFVKPSTRETDSLTLWNILKDAAVEGEYELDELDGTFTSLAGVSFDMQKSAVVESYNSSNGVVYVVSSLQVEIAERVKPIIIEAEYPYPDSLNLYTQKIFREVPNNLDPFTRSRPYASSGYDLYLTHTMNPGYVDYIIDGLNTVKYEMYWVSVHEVLDGDGLPEDTVGYTQSLRKMKWGAPDTVTFERELEFDSTYISNEILPSHISNPIEQSLGVMTIDTLNHEDAYYNREQGYFRSKNAMRLRVQGSGNRTPIALDYIKLVPILE